MKKFMIVTMLTGTLLSLTGFNLDRSIVPKDEILAGGPPKDGIPALFNPKFIRPDEADFLGPDDQVIGVRLGHQARAYPIKILNWHEAVNDTIEGVPIVVTF
jgi:hypothetical protein